LFFLILYFLYNFIFLPLIRPQPQASLPLFVFTGGAKKKKQTSEALKILFNKSNSQKPYLLRANGGDSIRGYFTFKIIV